MDIGSTLRETRIRAGISVEEIEQRTKIRAKYLRALENEEWSLLPGSAYVTSFLRSYAEALGLDARLFVDEYRRRFQEPSESELAQYGEPVLSGRVTPRRRYAPQIPGWAVGAFVVILLLVALGVLGSLGGDEEKPDRVQTVVTDTATERPETQTTATEPRRAARPRLARLTLGAAAPVWMCVVDNTGRIRVNARVVQPGQRVGPLRSRRFRVTFGNGSATMRLNGRRLAVPEVSEPIGYVVTPRGRRPLPEGRRPTCA